MFFFDPVSIFFDLCGLIFFDLNLIFFDPSPHFTPKPCDSCHFWDCKVTKNATVTRIRASKWQKHKENAPSKAKPSDICHCWKANLPKPKENTHSKIDCQKPEKQHNASKYKKKPWKIKHFLLFEALCSFFPVFGNLFWNAYFP